MQPDAATGVHRRGGECGGMAADGAGATGRPRAAHPRARGLDETDLALQMLGRPAMRRRGKCLHSARGLVKPATSRAAISVVSG